MEPAAAGCPFEPVVADGASISLPILLQKWNPNKPITVPLLGAAVRGEPRAPRLPARYDGYIEQAALRESGAGLEGGLAQSGKGTCFAARCQGTGQLKALMPALLLQLARRGHPPGYSARMCQFVLAYSRSPNLSPQECCRGRVRWPASRVPSAGDLPASGHHIGRYPFTWSWRTALGL